MKQSQWGGGHMWVFGFFRRHEVIQCCCFTLECAGMFNCIQHGLLASDQPSSDTVQQDSPCCVVEVKLEHYIKVTSLKKLDLELVGVLLNPK